MMKALQTQDSSPKWRHSKARGATLAKGCELIKPCKGDTNAVPPLRGYCRVLSLHRVAAIAWATKLCLVEPSPLSGHYCLLLCNCVKGAELATAFKRRPAARFLRRIYRLKLLSKAAASCRTSRRFAHGVPHEKSKLHFEGVPFFRR